MTDNGDTEREEAIEAMAPPSEDNDHCGNCWRPIGSTEWCPHCTIERTFETDSEQ